MNFSKKILLATVGAVTAITLIALLIQRSVIREQGVDLIRNKLQASIKQAESARDSVSRLNTDGAFDHEKLLAELHEAGGNYRETVMYETIPVVAAWERLEAVAQEEDMVFRVVRENPRNRKNVPDAYEREILRQLESGQKQFFDVREDEDLVTLARPIVLTQDCLACHGDPANSPTGDGRDVLGFEMEGWEAGQVRGAFILTAPTERIDAVVASGMGKTVLWALPCAVLICVGVGLLVRYTVVRPLSRTIDEVQSFSEQTEIAAGEISKGSISLAETTTEQASSLEETSASLQEMAGATERNRDRAVEARKFAEDANSAAGQGSSRMGEMDTAMEAIRTASTEITAITKTIDEIAFQTNILALNAAVEAARAGEAGAGFAVVADEVRSLAARSAEAARNAAGLVEKASERSESGTAICKQVGQDLQDIVERVEGANRLIEEVARSNDEQNAGIDQINRAVESMDQATQSSAASAEENASASAELTAQAESLRNSIAALRRMVGGSVRAAPRKADSPAGFFVNEGAPASSGHEAPAGQRKPERGAPEALSFTVDK
jgi:methyl-accepting chemotaxis protein